MYFKKIRERLKEGKIIHDNELDIDYYTRVSSNKENQLSLEEQKKYFEKNIKKNNIRNLVCSYFDKYIFDTSEKHKLF